jgi:hypothetical protein
LAIHELVYRATILARKYRTKPCDDSRKGGRDICRASSDTADWPDTRTGKASAIVLPIPGTTTPVQRTTFGLANLLDRPFQRSPDGRAGKIPGASATAVQSTLETRHADGCKEWRIKSVLEDIT